ncbi:unnamed protein product [Onchocerca flexuosa]|uniref:Transmembrane protein n=1 Tax=Onchocerca flexuosa TaxID=387005 RepID=A0A183HED7_9BILA|nr:unnamed protein product [Onchocerca flexuosa]
MTITIRRNTSPVIMSSISYCYFKEQRELKKHIIVLWADVRIQAKRRHLKIAQGLEIMALISVMAFALFSARRGSFLHVTLHRTECIIAYCTCFEIRDQKGMEWFLGVNALELHKYGKNNRLIQSWFFVV